MKDNINGEKRKLPNSQLVPEMVTREEFTQFTANLTNTLNMQQKKMEEIMQRLARNETAPAPEADAPHSQPRGLGGSYIAGQYRSSISRPEDRLQECHEERNQRSLESKQSSSGSRRNRRRDQRHRGRATELAAEEVGSRGQHRDQAHDGGALMPTSLGERVSFWSFESPFHPSPSPSSPHASVSQGALRTLSCH